MIEEHIDGERTKNRREKYENNRNNNEIRGFNIENDMYLSSKEE